MGSFALRALGALVLIATPLAALAQEGSRGHLFIGPMGQIVRGDDGLQAWFEATDSDHSGGISIDEFRASASAFLAHVDANHDNTATSAESTALWYHEAPEILSHEGGEREAPLDPNAEPEGTNHHDHVHLSEEADYGLGHQRPSRGPAHVVLSGAARFGLLNDVEPVMSCDADFSGRVSADEFTACADRRFAILDSNHDGALTLDETRAARAALTGEAAN